MLEHIQHVQWLVKPTKRACQMCQHFQAAALYMLTAQQLYVFSLVLQEEFSRHCS